jgi:hypothetical protein
MRIRKDLLIGAVALTCLAGAAQANSMNKSTSSQPLSRQTTGQSTSSSSQVSLTTQQKQQIFNAAQSLPQENAQAASLSPGSKVPSNITLHPLPQQAKQNVGSTMQNSEIAKLQNGDVIVVNPSNKTVQAVITPQDANSTTGSSSGMSNTPAPSK